MWLTAFWSLFFVCLAQDPPATPNRKLKVASAVWNPWTADCGTKFTTLTRNSECNKPGISNEIMGFILDASNIDYEVIPLPNLADWGRSPDSGPYWSGLLGQLQNGTYDAISSVYFITSKRLETFAYTNPVGYVPNTLMYKEEANTAGDFMALFRIFTPTLWSYIGSLCLVIALLFALNASIFQPEIPKTQQISDGFWTVIGFVTDQCDESNNEFPRNTHSSRVLMASLGLLAIFVISLYEGSLLSSLMRKNHNIPFKGTSSLAVRVAAGDYKVIQEPGIWFESYMESPDLIAFQMLNKAVAKHPIIYEMDPVKIVKRLKSGEKLAWPTDGPQADNFLSKYCGLAYQIDEDLTSSRAAFIFRKNQSKLIDTFNEVINIHINYINYVVNRYKPTPQTSCAGDAAIPALTIYNVLALIYFVIGGFVFGSVLFTYEIIRPKIKGSRFTTELLPTVSIQKGKTSIHTISPPHKPPGDKIKKDLYVVEPAWGGEDVYLG